MKAFRYFALVIVLVVANGWLAMLLTFRAGNLAKEPFRREQRTAALMALSKDPSPEKKAAYREELRLASRHATYRDLGRAGIVFAALVVIETVVFHQSRKNDAKRYLRL